MLEKPQVPEPTVPERAPSQRTRPAMVPIPQSPEGRARAKAEILMRVNEFIGKHKGHAVSHRRQTEDHESLHAVCEICQETLTVSFEYEAKAPSIAEEKRSEAGEPISVP
jgi:hypothetical protein